MTPGSRAVRHPGVGMLDTRVSMVLTPGCQIEREYKRKKKGA